MAQRTEFTYHNIELYKTESLGSGSYGGVCKAKCDGLLCAAKIMHPTLFDLRDPGRASYMCKFQEECHLLSLARHPNIVQYLATYYDPETRLPVLLMELCDESLTTFLERSPQPLSYHIELNICHNIALALVYLHSNGLIHRDLTGNNVLMIAGPKAKITDFGMSKLATVNPRMTALTLCPGNLLYMSPEAVDEAKSYTAKLDIFSFGVIVIQILTRKFPDPTDRFRTIQSDENDEDIEEVRVVVSETVRRQAHLKLIPDTHSLRPHILLCLKKERLCPSALELSERLSELKQSSQYTESSSLQQARSSNTQHLQEQRILTENNTGEASEYRKDITELHSIVEEKQHTIEANVHQLEEKEQIINTRNQQLQERQHTLEEMARQLQEKDETINENKRKLQEMEHAMATKQRELSQAQEHLQASENLVFEFQQSLLQNDRTLGDLQENLLQKNETISDLQETLSAHRRSQQLKLQPTVSGEQTQKQPLGNALPQATTEATQNDISKMAWREGGVHHGA